jgi:ribosomal protein S27AE
MERLWIRWLIVLVFVISTLVAGGFMSWLAGESQYWYAASSSWAFGGLAGFLACFLLIVVREKKRCPRCDRVSLRLSDLSKRILVEGERVGVTIQRRSCVWCGLLQQRVLVPDGKTTWWEDHEEGEETVALMSLPK